ncbi:MAG TPA: DUF1569 domain-containing protein [Bacteroidia bacterium]|jgi:hypothetical protein|nr:DUF1569 domain-containing protein [Bacteroidia bacterium]
MKTLYNESDTTELLKRLDQLRPDSQRLWGKMSADQMLAHCTEGVKMGTGELNLPRPLIGKILGTLLKSFYSNDKPFHKDSPTAPGLLITDVRNFDAEKEKLRQVIVKFQKGGEASCTRHPHPFFGKLTPEAWGIGMYKHLDHHFRQFGA